MPTNDPVTASRDPKTGCGSDDRRTGLAAERWVNRGLL